MKIALIFVMVVSTALVAIWFLLLFAARDGERLDAAYGALVDNIFKRRELLKKDEDKRDKLSAYSGVAKAVMGVFYGGDGGKAIAKLDGRSEGIQAGDLSSVGFIALPGHALLRRFPSLVYSPMFKGLLIRSTELYGRKYAKYKAKCVFAALMSYVIVGAGVTLAFGSFLLALEMTLPGLGVLVIGTAIVVLLAYSKFDEVRAKANRRREAIARQFPNVVSKLALLVCSGMIMDRAWRETAGSREGELYQEMKLTGDELSQNIAPEAAYSSFIVRCNTKETSKLASAILQNISKGNAEIGDLLRGLAREAWQERRHTAKRDAEKANGRLIIPTMMLFLSILIMIMVPLAMSMQGAM
jgi:tight adherence protein C